MFSLHYLAKFFLAFGLSDLDVGVKYSIYISVIFLYWVLGTGYWVLGFVGLRLTDMLVAVCPLLYCI